ncbi:MAG: hypothetical protein SPL13_05405, partial [Clostridia bacterium]|nr:hypothetical protein [Clostridia bacterium]
YDLNDNVGYEERDIPSRIIAYGVAAEYSLTARAFEESLMWRDRYEKGIKQAVPKKSATLKGREFI